MKYLLSGHEIKIWEKKAMENYKIPSILLMERAALAVVKELETGDYHLQRVLVVCGMGNNGGDGMAVARILKTRGIFVELYMVGDPEYFTPEARQQMEMYQAVSGKLVTSPSFSEYTVIVDAIFGIGCNREIKGIAAEVIQGMNKSEVPVVAIDVPSGVSADTGKLCGCGVRADATVTFFAKKLGMVLYPGAEHCGKIIVEDLGLPFDRTEECRILTYEEEDLKRLPKRKGNSHKGTCGKVLVMAGSPKICGAAYLSAAGAYKAGAGLVKLYTTEENLSAMQILLPEALIEIYDRDKPLVKQLEQCMEWADAIVIGPGLGTDPMAEKLLKYVWNKSRVPIVIDADGINLLAKNKSCLSDIRVPVILTPHIQEMARLSGIERDTILRSTVSAAKSFTETYNVTLVLKDARTVVAKKNELLYVNTSGNTGMSTGGSGDVLAGVLGGLLAQGMGDLETARLGVYLHGRAGDAAALAKGVYSMTARDILDGIAEVTRV